jgi:16S rRNA processing protein RimM
MNDLTAIAKLTAPFGIKGYLRAQLLTHTPERMADLSVAYLGLSPANAVEVVVEDVLFQHKGCIVKLASVPDRTAAERVAGKFLFVPDADRVKPPRGEYFVDDIIGCQVQTAEGVTIGKIRDVLKYPAQDVWLIASRGKTFMMPAVKEFIKRVDVKNHVVVVQGIEGFLEE